MRRIITIILTLLTAASFAQTATPIYQGSKYYEFRNAVRIDSAFFAPRRDTVISDLSLKAEGMLTYRPQDKSMWYYNGAYWNRLSSGTSFAIDSVRRSRDTLYFRYTTGGELAVAMNYYTKSESDERYVLSPSGKIKTSWVNAWPNGIGNEVPNVANIDTKYMIVNASEGDTTFTVTGGTGTSDFTPPFVAVVYDHTNDRHISFWVPRSSGSAYSADRPLPALSGDTVKTMHDSYEGQHLTDYGYYSLADYLYFQKKQLTDRDYKLYSFYAEDSPASNPFVAIGGAVQGGFIPSTPFPQTLGYVTANIAPHTITRTRYQVQQGSVAGRGVEWTANLGGKTGYLETFVGTNQQLPGHARVSVILDGITVYDKVIFGAAQKITIPYKNVSSGTLRIVTADTNPTSISVCRTTWYQSDVDSTTNMYAGGKIVFLGNSWTQFPFIGAVPMKAVTERFKHHIIANGGDPSDVINVGRGGMTSAWGKYWFKQLVLDNNPKYVYIEFFVNDANSSGSVGNPAITSWNFSSTGPYAAGTDVEGKVSQADWIANINWMIDSAKAHNIIPIVLMNHPTGSILQTQTQSNWGSVLKRANQYYDIETFFSSSIYADKSVTTPQITAINANVDTTSTRVISGGTGTTSVKVLLKNTNSSANRSLDVVFTNSQAGTVNRVLSVSNSDASDFFFVTADGLAQAQGFNILPTANRGLQFNKIFNISSAGGVARISATNSTSMDYLYVADSFRRTIRMRIPVTLPVYATSSIPTGTNQDQASMVYDNTVNKFAGSNGAQWRYFAIEDSVNKRYDSIAAKNNFIRNSAAYFGAPQTADILNLGTIRNDGAVVINGSLRLNTGTDNKWNLYYRDSTNGQFTPLAPAAYGSTLKAGPGGKPEWVNVSGDFIGNQNLVSQSGGGFWSAGSGRVDGNIMRVGSSSNVANYTSMETSTVDGVIRANNSTTNIRRPLTFDALKYTFSDNANSYNPLVIDNGQVAIDSQVTRFTVGYTQATNPPTTDSVKIFNKGDMISGARQHIASTGDIAMIGRNALTGRFERSIILQQDAAADVAGQEINIGKVPLAVRSSTARLAVGDSINVGGGYHGIGTYDVLQSTSASLGAYAALDSRPRAVGSTGFNHFIGLQSRPVYECSGNVGFMYSAWFVNTHNGAGTIGKHAGLQIDNPLGTGPITNNYGIFIQGQTRGSTINYNLWSENGSNFFGGTASNSNSTVVINGSIAIRSFTVSASTYTMSSVDYFVMMSNTSGATATLPDATSSPNRIYVIKKTSNNSNAVTINTTSSQTIDGVTSTTLTTFNEYIHVLSDGANWRVIARGGATTATPTLDQVTTAGNTTTNIVNVGSLGVSGTVSHSGALYNAPKVVTGTYSVLVSDHIILVDNGSAATLTLPSATGLDGLTFEIKKISNNVNNVTIATTSSQLVDDGAGPTITYNKSYRFIAYNGGWKILSQY